MNPRLIRLNTEPILRQLTLAFFILITGLMIGYLASFPSNYRLIIAMSVFVCLFAISLRKPVIALFILIILLPFTGLFRRMLIPIAGWTSFDPILLVAPLLILILGVHWLVKRWIFDRELIAADTRLFKFVLLFLLLSCVQIVNPLQGSLLVGAGGVLYFIVPLFWMVLAKEYFDIRLMRILYAIVYPIGVIVGIYGLIQTHVGFASFENAWVELGGYAALRVGESVRAFSVFPSAQEYSTYLSICILIGWAYLFRGKMIMKIPIICTLPLLGYAMIMIGTRTQVILTTLSITVVTLVMYRSLWARMLIVVIAIAAGMAGMNVLNNLTSSENDLVSHLANGLTNPLDEKHSTLILHAEIFWKGIVKGFQVPIGHGLGSSTQAAKTFSVGGQNTEYDIGDIMVSHGVIGGVLFVLIMFMVLRLLFALPKHDPIHLALAGVLLATIGFWLIGELTAVNAVLWLSIGYLDKAMKHHRWNVMESNRVYRSKVETV